MTSQITSLHPKISRHFNLNELSLLCFYLNIDFEELAGETKSKKVQSFLEFIVRRSGEDTMFTLLEKERPNVAWRVGPSDDLVNPYKGLTAFTVADAAYFFGRKQVTVDLLQMVKQAPFVAILGASGSGKSSVVFAGLVAQVAAESIWLTVSYRPGKEPYVSMAGALLQLLEGELSETSRLKELDNLAGYLSEKPENLGRVLARILEKHTNKEFLLLIIDQFEELYTLVPEAEVHHKLVDSLLAAREVDGIRLVLTMRADFLGQALTYPPLVAALQNSDLKLGPMTPEELRAAITEPARKVHVTFAPGLEERILNDVVDEPGYLPLLQFALTRLWDEQQGGQLTHAGYEEVGGVAGALVQYADETWESLDAEEQETARQVFTRLVRPGLGTEDTRRVATRRQLTREWELTRWLADKRLVVTGRNELEEETAEIVHEALIQRWGKLRKWLEEDREFLTWREGLGTAVTQWAESGEDEGVLLRSSVLATAEGWLTEQRQKLSPQERTFVEASIAYREAMIAEAEEQRQRELQQAQQIAEEEQKRSTLFRRALIGGGVLVLFLLVAIVFAGVQWDNSLDNLRDANVQRLQSEARALAAESSREFNNDRTQSLALAVRAVHETYFAAETCETIVKEADIALVQALLPGSLYASLDDHTFSVESAAFSPDGKRIVTAGGGCIVEEFGSDCNVAGGEDHGAKVWSVQTGKLITSLDGHTLSVNSAVFSPDGEHIVTASSDTTAKVWDAQTGKLVTSLDGHTEWVNSAVFSPDGERIVTAGWATAKVWDAQTGKLITSLRAHTDSINSAAFSPDGEHIVTASSDTTAKVWDAQTGKLITSLDDHTEWVNSAVFSPDGERIVTASGNRSYTGSTLILRSGIVIPSEDPSAKVWDAQTGELITSLDDHTDSVKSATFSPDGEHIVTASSDTTAKVWDAQTGKLVTSLNEHTNSVVSATFSPDGSLIVTASWDNTAKVWDVQTGKLVTSLDAHTATVNSAAFSPDGSLIVTASSDNTAKVWDVRTRAFITSLNDHALSVLSVAFSPDGERIVTASSDTTAKVWDAQTGELIASLDDHMEFVKSAVFSPDGERIVTAGEDTTAKVWDAQTGELITSLDNHTDKVWSAAFSPDGARVVTASGDTTAKVWDAQTGALIASLDDHGFPVVSAVFSPDGERIITASGITVKVWDARTGELIVSFDSQWFSAAFSPDGGRVVTTSDDNFAKVWDAQTGDLITFLFLGFNTDRVRSTTFFFSPDGERIVTASEEDAAYVWDAQEGDLIASLDGHTGAVRSATFSPDGERIVTASDDNTAKVWDPQTGEIIVSLEDHTGPVNLATFSPDGERIVTASDDNTVKVWGVVSSISGMLAEAEERLARLLSPEEFAAIFDNVESCTP